MVALWHGLLANVAVVAILVSAWTHTQDWRQGWAPAVQSLAFGGLLAAGTILLMLLPVELRHGVFFDLRTTLIALSAFFGGPLAVLVTALVAASYRIAVGGAGVLPGLIAIGTAAAIGLAWHALVGRREKQRVDIVGLAAVVAVGTLVGLLFLPAELRDVAFRQVAAPIAILSFVATLLAGLALQQEDRRQQAARENLAYRTIIESLPDSLNVKDLKGRFLAANPATARLMGAASSRSLIGKTDFDFLPPVDAQRFRADEVAALAADQAMTVEQELHRDDGVVGLSTLKLPLRDQRGQVIGLITHNRDVTMRKRLEQELLDSRNQLSSAMTQMADGLAMFDREDRLVFCNEQYRSYFPLTTDLRIPGASFRTILKAVVERGEQQAAPVDQAEAWIDAIAASLHEDGEEEVHLFDGRWLHIRTRPSPDGSSMVVVSDITKIKRAETELLVLTEQLKLLASTDGLTGLMNRRALDEALEAALALSARERTTISLLLVDIDRFKAFNDLYGHPAGDECLKLVSRCFEQALKRPADLAARYGGEEFVGVLPETTEDGAFHIADSFRQSLRDLGVQHDGSEKGVVTASVGIATYLPGERSRLRAELIARADEALYGAKAAGRDRVNGWRPHPQIAARVRHHS